MPNTPTPLNHQNQTYFSSVHASAGSGKTFHLVSHIIQMLVQGASPASILAITFTRKAAAEMQQRLLERVLNLATCSDSQLDSALLQQLNLTDSETHRIKARQLYEDLLHAHQGVRTTTFHAFCQDLLRRFPMESSLPPGFELIERTGYLIDEAWNRLTSRFTQSANENKSSPAKDAMETLLRHFGTDKTRSILKQFISSRSEWWALSQSPGFQLETYLGNLAQDLNTSVNETAESLMAQYFQAGDNVKLLTRFSELLGLHPIKTHSQFITLINHAFDISPSAAFEVIWSVFFTVNDEARARKSNKTLLSKLGPEGCETFLAIHATQCERLIAVRESIHANETLIMTQAWLSAGQAYLSEYQALKHLHRYLDFSDLEWQCYCLLNTSDHAQWIQYKLDQRIEHLLVDEFQDTNPTQWLLILPLLTEIASADQERLRSVLFVGDTKQSIYRFRRAEPRLFATASKWMEDHLHAHKQYLNQSYRSSPAIIDFVNRLFTDNPALPLTDFQTHLTHKDHLSGSVKIMPLFVSEKKTELVSTELRNPLHHPRPDTLTHHSHEARAIAGMIISMLEDKIVLGSDRESKYISASDILILLRNRNNASEYEHALREAHIPYLGTERGTLLDSLEIKDMVNLLQWLITPFDNHALAGVLRSPLFCASNEDLFSLAGKSNWFDSIIETSELRSDAHPLKRAAALLSRWTTLIDKLPVHDLLDRIYCEANVLERYQANYPEHLRLRVQSNLTRFIELALENDSGRYPSLTRFLSWLRLLKQQDKEAPDQPASDAEHERVKILTIHEAKGLEAAVVFLVDSSTTKTNKGGENVIIDWPSEAMHPQTLFLSPSASYPNRLSAKILEQQKIKDHQENANLLYVAITRAKQHLIISASKKSDGWYHSICTQLDIDPSSTQPEATDIENYLGTQSQPASPVEALGTKAPVEPRLQAPIKFENTLIEIAPSHIDTGSHQSREGVDRDVEPDEERAKALTRGEIIHAMLNFLADNPTSVLTAFQKSSSHTVSEPDFKAYWQQALETIKNFPNYFEDTFYDVAFCEVPVYFQKEGRTVHGIIDRLVVTETEAIIIDYKTHEFALDRPKTQLNDTAEQYRSQLNLYKQGIVDIYPTHQIRTMIIFTHVATCIEIT